MSTDVLSERLMRHRRDAGTGSAPGAPVGGLAGAPTSSPAVRRRLLTALALRGRGLDTAPTQRQAADRDRELPGREIAPGLRLVESEFACPSAPGRIETAFVGPRWRGPAALGDAELLHFDTETTGLAGGTGTRAFMIGAASWSGGRLRLRQLLITRLGAEASMLAAFARWLHPDTVLVSYNGKCYDAPLLATRYRLAGLDDPLAGRLHMDLLHPVRRRFRSNWSDCRLATTERRLLGVVRVDDLPGAEAPNAWRSFLRGGAAHGLRRVLLHNAQDLRSLAALSGWWAEHGIGDDGVPTKPPAIRSDGPLPSPDRASSAA